MRRAAVVILAGVVVLLVLAQLLLPGFATRRLRDQLSAHGTVVRVEVHAFPAIELLWHQADRVVIQMADYRASGAGGSSQSLAQSLDQTSGVTTLDASAQRLSAGLLTLRDATLRKRGSQLTGSATVTQSDLRAAVPFLVGIQPVAASGGQLVLRGTATLLGVTATVNAAVTAAGGQITVAPQVPLGGLATITVFSDPHLQFQTLSTVPTASGFRVNAAAGQG